MLLSFIRILFIINCFVGRKGNKKCDTDAIRPATSAPSTYSYMENYYTPDSNNVLQSSSADEYDSKYSGQSSSKTNSVISKDVTTIIPNSGSITALHELCNQPNPSSEIIKIYASTYPWSLKQKDSNGNIPLHVALNREDPIHNIICILLGACPESAKIKDKNNVLPLLLAVSRSKISPGVIKSLLQAYPEAASIKCYGSFAIHHLIQKGNPSAENVRLLLQAYPSAASIPNNYGNLPLHFLCSSKSPTADALRILMLADPSTITYKNHLGETPIMRAIGAANECDKPEIKERCRLLLRIADRSILNDDQISLLKELNWQARKVIILLCVQYTSIKCDENGVSQESDIMELYHSCPYDIWRLIISYL